LVNLMKGRRIECEPKTTDRYGRTVAICRADGVDLGMATVLGGTACAFTRYSRDYAQQEAEAKAAELGIHAHGCKLAWDWRARQR
jgi:endonuclease YncB( thermonuclease family)